MTESSAVQGGTVVFVHGLWLNPRSWDPWAAAYRARGYRTLAPGWPGMDVDVDVLRKDPSVMDGLGVREVADHYEGIVRGLDAPPVIVGHSFGGLITQILLDRGLGRAGVAISPAPPKGVLRLPVSALRASFPVLRNPANARRTVALTPAEWRYAFCNTMTEAESRAAYEALHVPAPGRPLFQAAVANLRPDGPTRVDFRNGGRAPLLLVSGGSDHIVPPSLVRENFARNGRSSAVTELTAFDGRPHFICGAPGWEEVAEYAITWAEGHGRP